MTSNEGRSIPGSDRLRWHRTGAGAVGVALALMVPAALENGVVPWSPFYCIYVALAVGLPLVWGTYRFGPPRAVRWWQWALCPVVAVGCQFLGSIAVHSLSPVILGALGVPAARMSEPGYDMGAMFDAMFQAAAPRLGLEVARVRTLYLGFLVLWAGLGEELFYRGYVQSAVRRRRGPGLAIVVAAFLFAIRHYTQMGLLWPHYPWAAATAWVAIGFLFGLVLGYVYERTRSLWMPVVIHYLFNILPFVLG